MSAIPIVVVHNGYSSFLDCCLNQARKTNPESPIVLIGDEQAAQVSAVKTGRVRLAILPEGNQQRELTEKYVHLSPLKKKFERFCIERWFMVRDLANQEEWDRCLYIDSDVLLFDDMTKEYEKRFVPFDMSLARWDDYRLVGHCNFISSVSRLSDFCSHILDVYSDPVKLEKLKENSPHEWAADGCWVSDMSFLRDFASRSDVRIRYLDDLQSENVYYDRRITDWEDFKTMPGSFGWRAVKDITFIRGVPYVTKNSGIQLEAKAIHYHGHAKYLMPLHCTGKNHRFRQWLGFLICEAKAGLRKV